MGDHLSIGVCLPAGRQGTYLGFVVWNLEFPLCLGIGERIQVGIDLFKRIGQEENPDANQEKAARDVDDSHVSFYFIKGREE